MRAIFKPIGIVHCILFSCCVAVAGSEGMRGATSASEYDGKVAYLQNGEVCTCNKDGTEKGTITQTGGVVDDFIFSPRLEYLAFTKISGYVEAPGLWEDEEEIPQTAVYAILIMHLKSKDILTEIEPEDGWLNLRQWSGPDRLLYYLSSGFDVFGFCEYNLQTKIRKELDYQKGHQLMFSDVSSDGRHLVYLDDAGLGADFRTRVHLVDRGGNEDRIVASKRLIFNPTLSHDKKSIAFIETESVDDERLDHVWLYDIERDSLKKVYTAPANAKSDSWMSWSVSDFGIGLFFPSIACVFALQNPSEVHEIAGRHFCWLDDDGILFGRGADIFLYDMRSREETLFMAEASKPVYLKVAQ